MINRQGAKEEPNQIVDALAKQVIGAALEVHNHLGPGYLEAVYGLALAHEMSERNISYQQQYAISVPYKGIEVGQSKLDFLVADHLVVEIKAVDQLAPVHKAQVISYLKACNLQLGLLINFGQKKLVDGLQRIVLTH